MNKYLHAYQKLKADYEKVCVDNATLDRFSPIKDVQVLKTKDGVPTVTLTHMEATALDGESVDKLIYVNDETNTTDDDVFLLSKHHERIARYHNDGLTRVRCGIMTCVALGECLELLPLKVRKVGFIGNGLTNLQNAACIADVFGVHDFIIRGSARNRAKHRDLFEQYGNVAVDDTDGLLLLNECDVVVSCTSTCDRKDQISDRLLHGPKILIALDTGYLLDESFRKDCESYCDDVDQLNRYYREEFIFDKGKVQLKQLSRDHKIKKERICAYLFGISFADAEIAEMAAELGIK